jgi:hypothetical protein
MTLTKDKKTKSISIPCHPYHHESGLHAIEKEDSTGLKRRYLQGISSGVRIDGEGERLTENAIKGLLDQAKEKNILLYAGLHDVNFQDDIGILVDSSIINDGKDWFTVYRLYDEYDNLGSAKTEAADNVWKQVNGLPPYSKPAQKGFSVEGVVPLDSIISKKINKDGSYSQRVVDYMVLDGVVLVNRPAYTASFATAVYKCLGELHPVAKEKSKQNIQQLFIDHVSQLNSERAFYQSYYQMNDLMEDQIIKIMRLDDRPEERLKILFDQYRDYLIPIIIENQTLFSDDDQEIDNQPVEVGADANQLVLQLSKVASEVVTKIKELKKE